MSHVVTAALWVTARAVTAQAIPTTIEAAETEGAAFPHRSAPASVQAFFAGQFGGTAERKCVAPTPPIPGGSLRSGEFIIRSPLLVWPGVLAPPLGYKILWVPLHNPFEHRGRLLIRAARVRSASDSFRQTVADWSYSAGGPKTASGFPSLVNFPAAGQWLVVATAGDNWGCFLLRVAERPAIRAWTWP